MSKEQNPMTHPKIEKATVNICVGSDVERLKKAEKVIKLLTNRKSIRTISKVMNKDWGIRKGDTIGCKVTLRGGEAEDFLKRAFKAKGDSVAEYSFDSQGNLSFGISDYTDFEGLKYDPNIGAIGLDVSITLERSGYRIKHRKRKRSKIPHRHQIDPDETMNFLTKKLGIKVV
jgi:large subunit ribosomal protein L5